LPVFYSFPFDDLVKSKISPPLAGGDDGEGDKYLVEIS
jgi:hypothetical protein